MGILAMDGGRDVATLEVVNEVVMARVFSIDIPFRDKMYIALVSVTERGHDLHCTVRYIDKGLKYILSGDKLVFTLQQGLKTPQHLPNELAQSLVECTTIAIADYFHHRA
ncbi:hypothetical protein [Pseudocnuella soli]|uniref:hypothetical protein n=1 Tax=Pseudocnuella soli TaxID=2502779 RepID=UPI00104E0C33|nr:hypothetical protein [Pseudocnuella soli]